MKTIITFIIAALILISIGSLASRFPIEVAIISGTIILFIMGYWVWTLEKQNT